MAYIIAIEHHFLTHHHLIIIMAKQLPSKVVEALTAGTWKLVRFNKHFIFQRKVGNVTQTLVIGMSPRANEHGGGHLILSRMRHLDEEVGWNSVSRSRRLASDLGFAPLNTIVSNTKTSEKNVTNCRLEANKKDSRKRK